MKKIFFLILIMVLSLDSFCQVGSEYIMKAISKGRTGDYFGAIQDYTLALEAGYPDSLFVFHNRGRNKMKLEDFIGAITDFNRALNHDPNYILALSYRGDCKENLGDHRGAINDYSVVIDLIKDSNEKSLLSEIYSLRGVSKVNLQNHNEGISDFSKAIELDLKNSKAYYNRGLSRIKLKQLNDGCLDLSKAGELGNREAYDAIRNLCNKPF